MSGLVLYSRQGCHLCEVLLEELLPRIRGRQSLEILDIDTREDLRNTYNDRVPVLEFDGRLVCQYTLDVRALERCLQESTKNTA